MAGPCRTALLATLLACVALADAQLNCTGAAFPTVVNGKYTGCSIAEGASCTATCNPGYTSIPGPTPINCVNGAWTPAAAQTCLRVCTGEPPLTPFVGWGDASNSFCTASVPWNSYCIGACQFGKVGSPTILCASGSFTTQVGKCVDPAGACLGPLPAQATNAAPWPLSCKDSANGYACPTYCNGAYGTPSGPIATTTCTNGAWSTPVPCVKVCLGALPVIPNVTWGSPANANCVQSIPGKGVCAGTCGGGTTGSISITCNPSSLQWASSTVTGACSTPGGACLSAPDPLINGEWEAGCSGKPSGQTCTFSCKQDANASMFWGASDGSGPTLTATCVNGAWTTPAATCVRVCPTAPPAPPAGATWGSVANKQCNGTIPFNVVCNGTCAAGSAGTLAVTCTSEGFGPVTNTCGTPGSTCTSAPPALADGTWSAGCAGAANGGTCPGTCNLANLGGQLVQFGSSLGTGPAVTATCVAGSWQVNGGATCVRVCSGAPPTVPGTVVTWGSAGNQFCVNSVVYTDSCTGSCPAGQTGGYTSVCSGVSGIWSTPTGFCQSGTPNTTCGAPPALPNGQWTDPSCAGKAPGQTCGGTCVDSDFIYSSSLGTGKLITATCNSTGGWAVPASCVRVCPGAPAPVAGVAWGSGANAQCTSTIPYTTTCTGTCTGSGFTGGWTALCDGATGLWATPSGVCIPPSTGGCTGQPANPSNGRFSGCASANGTVCVATCTDTRVTSPPGTLYIPYPGAAVTATCVNSAWVRDANQCRRVLPPNQYGRPQVGCDGNVWLTPAVGSCNSQPVCVGKPTVPMVNGANGGWSNSCPDTVVNGTCPAVCNTGYSSAATVQCLAAPANTVSGANWATVYVGTQCTKTTGRRLFS